MAYKVNDVVMVRSDIQIDSTYGSCSFVSQMAEYIGRPLTIREVHDSPFNDNDDYFIYEDSGEWYWTDGMLVPYVPEEALDIEPEDFFELLGGV